MRGKYISGPAAVLVLVCFFLPWVTVSCSGQPIGQFSGYDLAAGVSAAAVPIPGDGWLFLVPIVALVTLVGGALAIVNRDWERATGVAVTAVSLLGLLLLTWRWLRFRALSGTLVAAATEPGLWLALAGLALMVLGGVLSVIWPGRATAVTSRLSATQPSAKPPVRASSGTVNSAPLAAAARNLAETPATSGAEAEVEPLSIADTAVRPIDRLEDQPAVLAWLIIRDGEQAGSQFRLRHKTVIGRHPSNDIVLDDSAMSTIHASVVWENGQFVLRDLQSTNGVYVKEVGGYSWQRVETAVLQNATQIKLGRTVLHMMIVASQQPMKE